MLRAQHMCLKAALMEGPFPRTLSSGASSVYWEVRVWVYYSPWASVKFGSSWGRMGPGSLWWGSLCQTLQGAGGGSLALQGKFMNIQPWPHSLHLINQ